MLSVGGKNGALCLMGPEFQFGKMEGAPETDGGDDCIIS